MSHIEWTHHYIDQWELDSWRPQLAQANIDAHLSSTVTYSARFEAYVKELVCDYSR